MPTASEPCTNRSAHRMHDGLDIRTKVHSPRFRPVLYRGRQGQRDHGHAEPAEVLVLDSCIVPIGQAHFE